MAYGIKLVVCKGCGEERPHKAHGLCTACYQAWYRKNNPPPSMSEVVDAARTEVVEFIDSFLVPFDGSCRMRGNEIVVSLQGKVRKLAVK